MRAGQTLTIELLNKAKRHAPAGLYVGPEWDGRTDDEPGDPAPQGEPRPGARILQELEKQQQQAGGKKGFKKRRHERKSWTVALTLAAWIAGYAVRGAWW